MLCLLFAVLYIVGLLWLIGAAHRPIHRPQSEIVKAEPPLPMKLARFVAAQFS